ncbi:PPC domain-containing protein [Archangium lansingense]|uniref:PPC domain-containing protein n=1 Tax=Archangium lansingense TaxID=2995310 RepID=A0ABT4A2E4_9BACT|nr:PPC domain-containing protein [Archangium lansinium]MCY1075815.1 PPC domain-containing protein [Archangium lansinium]
MPSSASWGNTVTLVTGVDGWDDDVTHPFLLNGAALVDLSENVGLKIAVPEGATKLTVTTQGPTGTSRDPGDVDLYILNLKPPSTTKYTCKSEYVGIKQVCTITNPPPGSWYLQTYLTSGTYDVKAAYE